MGDNEQGTEDLRSLSDEELERQIAESGKPAPDAADSTGEAAATTGEGEGAGETTPPETGEETGDTPPPATEEGEKPPETPGEEGEPPKLLAGKYKTENELAKGLVEIGKPLSINQEFLQDVVDLARKSGDFSKVEEMYGKLDGQLSQQREAEKAAAEAAPAKEPAPPATPSPETAEQREQLAGVIAEEVRVDLKSLPIARKLNEAGIDIPETKAAMDQLQELNPGLWVELRDEVKKLWDDKWAMTDSFIKAETELPTFKEQQRAEAKTKIKNLVSEYGLEFPETEIDKAFDEADSSGAYSEDRDGVTYPKSGGYYRHFMAEKLPDLLPEVRTKAEAKGREQYLADLKKMKEGTVDTVSTTKVPGAPATKEAKALDVNDREAVAHLSDEELQEEIAKRSKK
jgi:hypothetical protein